MTSEVSKNRSVRQDLPKPIRARRRLMSKEERKKQIVNVTRRLIERYGIQGATTARIAAAAGVTAPTLYRNFGSRKGILLAVNAEVKESGLELIQSSQHPDVLCRLYEIAETHNKRLLRQKYGSADVLFAFIASPSGLGLRKGVKEGNEALVARLEEIIDEGKSQGSIRPDVDSREMAWAVTTFLWVEDVAYLLGAQEVLSGLSTKWLKSFLQEGASEPQARPPAT